jgi:hypothetical protein
MDPFDTKTEESFLNFTSKGNIKCTKIKHNNDKSKSIPDFLCFLNNYKAIFELKDLNESGTTLKMGDNFIGQKITIFKTVSRFINECKDKFLNPDYKNYPSALVISNLRKFIFWNVLISQTEEALINNLKNHSEIGNVIITGYNQESNKILAFHIYENPHSNRTIDRNFFSNLNVKYYTLKS